VSAEPADVVDELSRVLSRACRLLAEAGQPQRAGRLAADGWVLLRRSHPVQAQRLDGTMHHAARLEQKLGTSAVPDRKDRPVPVTDRVVDVRAEIPRTRHELILSTFATLPAGAAFVLVNDHDPKPLYYQLAAENPGEFTWEYLDEGPEVWRVRIGRTGPE
jgi:uncharacterized protein (DUF2249 family)